MEKIYRDFLMFYVRFAWAINIVSTPLLHREGDFFKWYFIGLAEDYLLFIPIFYVYWKIYRSLKYAE